MEILRSLRRGNLLFQIIMIYLFNPHKFKGKFKDKEHLNLRCLVQVGPGERGQSGLTCIHPSSCPAARPDST